MQKHTQPHKHSTYVRTLRLPRAGTASWTNVQQMVLRLGNWTLVSLMIPPTSFYDMSHERGPGKMVWVCVCVCVCVCVLAPIPRLLFATFREQSTSILSHDQPFHKILAKSVHLKVMHLFVRCPSHCHAPFWSNGINTHRHTPSHTQTRPLCLISSS